MKKIYNLLMVNPLGIFIIPLLIVFLLVLDSIIRLGTFEILILTINHFIINYLIFFLVYTFGYLNPINNIKQLVNKILKCCLCKKITGLNITTTNKNYIKNNRINSNIRRYSTVSNRNKSFGWQYLTLEIQHGLLKENLIIYLKEFWKIIMKKYPKEQVVGVLVRLKSSNGSVQTIGPLQRINKTNFKDLIETLKLFLNMRADDYFSDSAERIEFQYILLNNSNVSIIKPTKKVIKSYKLGELNLPLTTDIGEWGTIVKKDENVITLQNPQYPGVLIVVRVQSDKQSYEFQVNGKIKFSLEDKFGVNDKTFTRLIGEMQTLHVQDGELLFKTHTHKVNFIKPDKPCKRIKYNFLTLDLETRTINGILKPYCVSIYDGSLAWSYYLSDYKSINEMIKAAISSIMRRQYNGYNIYIHNSSLFDIIFLLSILTEMGKVDPLKKDDKYINLRLSWDKYKDKKGNENYKYNINFRDSVLLLPAPLRKLAKAFNVEAKGFFPMKFVNDPNIPLDYIGNTPDFSYYDGITNDEYNSLISNIWNLKNETIKYCELDCKVLHQVINKFNKLIFDRWSINVHRYPTLSSLALGIFRTHYLGDHKIPKLAGKIYDFIRESYTGGRVDVFIPQGKDLYYYDVNSLYPTVYSSKPMPTGTPSWFEGDILKHNPDAFGFFKCEIEAPDYINVPILQTHAKTKSGIRTIAPLGKWIDVIFSEEMHLAIKHGYKINVLEGYNFEKDIVFDKYAADLFEIKSSHESSHPMYLISKLLLNSLYGRFGMALDLESHIVTDTNIEDEYLSAFDHITDVVDFNNGKSLISYIKIKENSDTTSKNVSIGIASSITSYARIHMQQYLQSKGYNVYYTDTDSIVTDKPIEPAHIGKELGQLKLEHKISKGVFLAPKVYSIINDEGKEITKVKGFKDKTIKFKQLEDLLFSKTTEELNQSKWFRDVVNSTITVRDQVYTLKSTDNKRQLFYDGNGLAIKTRPYKINNNKEVII